MTCLRGGGCPGGVHVADMGQSGEWPPLHQQHAAELDALRLAHAQAQADAQHQHQQQQQQHQGGAEGQQDHHSNHRQQHHEQSHHLGPMVAALQGLPPPQVAASVLEGAGKPRYPGDPGADGVREGHAPRGAHEQQHAEARAAGASPPHPALPSPEELRASVSDGDPSSAHEAPPGLGHIMLVRCCPANVLFRTSDRCHPLFLMAPYKVHCPVGCGACCCGGVCCVDAMGMRAQTHLVRFTRELVDGGAQPMPDQARDALIRYVDAFNRWDEASLFISLHIRCHRVGLRSAL